MKMKKILSTLIAVALASAPFTAAFADVGTEADAPTASVSISKLDATMYGAYETIKKTTITEGQSLYEIKISLANLPNLSYDLLFPEEDTRIHSFTFDIFTDQLDDVVGTIGWNYGDTKYIAALEKKGITPPKTFGAINTPNLLSPYHKDETHPEDDHLALTYTAGTNYDSCYPYAEEQTDLDVAYSVDNATKYKLENAMVYWILVDDAKPVTLKSTTFKCAIVSSEVANRTDYPYTKATVNYTMGTVTPATTDPTAEMDTDFVAGEKLGGQYTFYAPLTVTVPEDAYLDGDEKLKFSITDTLETDTEKKEKLYNIPIKVGGLVSFTAIVKTPKPSTYECTVKYNGKALADAKSFTVKAQ